MSLHQYNPYSLYSLLQATIEGRIHTENHHFLKQMLKYGKRWEICDEVVVANARRMKMSGTAWEHEFVQLTVYPSYEDFALQWSRTELVFERDFNTDGLAFPSQGNTDIDWAVPSSWPKRVPATDNIRFATGADSSAQLIASVNFTTDPPLLYEVALLVDQVTQSLGNYHLCSRNCYRFADLTIGSLAIWKNAPVVKDPQHGNIGGHYHGYYATRPQDDDVLEDKIAIEATWAAVEFRAKIFGWGTVLKGQARSLISVNVEAIVALIVVIVLRFVY